MGGGIWKDIDSDKLAQLFKGAVLNLGEVIILDEQGRMVYISNEYAENMGISIEDSLGKHILEVIPDSAIPNVMKSGVSSIEALYYRNGRTFWVNRVPIIKDGKLEGMVAQSILTSKIADNDLKQKFGYVIRQLNFYKNKYTQTHVARFSLNSIVSKSVIMDDLKNNLISIAKTHSTVLLSGESGTGKEVFANAIHGLSERRDHPFVKISCAAIPDSLLESELFGYVGGAFTGALKSGKIGDFEAANNGTIFLDEINSLSMPMQAKLLRVIQEKEIKKLGSTQPTPINVRFIFASNKDLLGMIKAGLFKEDFYYRINVLNLRIPPLRERLEDIEPLVNEFISKYNKEFSKNITGIDPMALLLLKNYDWPGNVRELENCIERAFNFGTSRIQSLVQPGI